MTLSEESLKEQIEALKKRLSEARGYDGEWPKTDGIADDAIHLLESRESYEEKHRARDKGLAERLWNWHLVNRPHQLNKRMASCGLCVAIDGLEARTINACAGEAVSRTYSVRCRMGSSLASNRGKSDGTGDKAEATTYSPDPHKNLDADASDRGAEAGTR